MNAVIEYISCGIIIFLVLGTTSQFATNMVYERVNLIEQRSGLENADKILDTLLLSPGSPPQWEDSFDDPVVLGLALKNAIQLYQLDFKKVQRISKDALPPWKVRDLLGLSAYYYISIKIHPLYNITVESDPYDDERFSVKVLNQWNIPVSNVEITAAYVNKTIQNFNDTDVKAFLVHSLDDAVYTFNITDAMGTCMLLFEGAGKRKSLLVSANQFNVKSLTTWPTLSEHVIGVIESSMGSPSGYNIENVYRNVEIDGLSYIIWFSIWS